MKKPPYRIHSEPSTPLTPPVKPPSLIAPVIVNIFLPIGMFLVLGSLILMWLAPGWTMKLFTNDHNDQAIEQIQVANDWLQSDCNIPKNRDGRDEIIQADLACLDTLRLRFDNEDPMLRRLERWLPLRQFTRLDQVDSCGWYLPSETMSPKEQAENPRPCQ